MRALIARPTRPAAILLLGAALWAMAALQACDTADHSGEPALLTIAADSAAMRYSRLLVILRDEAGDDTLWRDSLSDPAQLRRLPTQRYHGGPIQVILEGFADGSRVFLESRAFDPARRGAQRDTLEDFSVPLSRFGFDAPKLLLPYQGSSGLKLAVLPAKADGRVGISVSDPGLIAVSDSGRDAQGYRRYRVTGLKAGTAHIIAVANAPGNLADTVEVQVSRGNEDLLPPVNRSAAWSTSARPAWAWSHGGLAGIGFYAVSIDAETLDTTDLIGETAYASPDSLPDGPHTLYVWERAADGRFSPPAALTLRVDTRAPEAPLVAPAGYEATDSARPSWTWVPQGGGIGRFRVRLDSPDMDSGAFESESRGYSAPKDLELGPHVLRVQERDSAGNWSAAGQATVTLVPPDKTPPNAPARRFLGVPVWRDSLFWRSGGGGTGNYRYLIDKSDFAKDGPIGIRDSALIPPADLDTAIRTHYLRVQERDAVGNWSAAGEIAFGAAHFVFLRTLADTGFALTLAPDSTHLLLTRPVRAPAGDAEKALQKRQLWQAVQRTDSPGVRTWENPFYHVELRHLGGGQPPLALASDQPGPDSSRFWYQGQLAFTGGTPPPWYYFRAANSDDVLAVPEGPVSDTTALEFMPLTGPAGSILWLIDPLRETWWVD